MNYENIYKIFHYSKTILNISSDSKIKLYKFSADNFFCKTFNNKKNR